MTQTAIEWRHVSFSIRHGFWLKEKQILKDIHMSVPAGTVLGLVGPNGAGKTTTIKLAAGLLYPETGGVFIFGKPSANPSARTQMGLLTETQYIYHHLRLKEWLNMMAHLSGLKQDQIPKRTAAVLELFELQNQSDQLMHTLSKGQLQRSGLAQAMVHEPDILILDEPMSGLDPYWRYRVQQLLLDYKSSGKTILFSSHILADVERLSDHIALIEGGILKWEGSVSDMKRNVKSYEVVCRTDQPDILQAFVSEGKLSRQPEGEWVFTLHPDKKHELIKLTHDGLIAVESMRPVRQEIEEILFGLRRSASEKGK